MKLKKYAYLYSKVGNYTSKIMKKYLEIYLKTWKNHGNIMEFCQSGKVGTLRMRQSLDLDYIYQRKNWTNFHDKMSLGIVTTNYYNRSE